MPNLGPTELIIIAVILVMLFGAKKLPEAARGIGRSLRIFKSETAKLRDDDDTTAQHVTTQHVTTPQADATPGQPAAVKPELPQAMVLTPEEQARVVAERERAQAGLKDKQV